MTIFEQAASLIDDELLLEGELKRNHAVGGNTDRFFDLLERPAKQILDLKKERNQEAPNIDVIRKQYKELSREYERNFACANNRFISGFMKVFGIIMENLENGDTDYVYAAKWPAMFSWIKDNAQRIDSNCKNEAVLLRLADDYMTKVAQPALRTFKMNYIKSAHGRHGVKSRSDARADVKTMLDDPAFQELLRSRSGGRFDIMKGHGRRPPVIVDNEKRLTLNFRNYEELNDILTAKDENELYSVVKNQFDSPSGIYSAITSGEIPEGVEFQYQNDALVACDWSLKDNIAEANLRRGQYYLSDKKTVVLFVHEGESLRSNFDAGEEESRYVNEFASHYNELYIALNRNERFNKFYTNPNVKFDVFEIVQNDGDQKYVSRGTYRLDNVGDERIKYTRESDSIARSGTMAESFITRFAGYLLD